MTQINSMSDRGDIRSWWQCQSSAGIVEIQTELKSPIGRLVLANSITLTPGTLVVDIKGDTLFIHWINVSSKDPVSATRQIAGQFEKYLKVIYG